MLPCKKRVDSRKTNVFNVTYRPIVFKKFVLKTIYLLLQHQEIKLIHLQFIFNKAAKSIY